MPLCGWPSQTSASWLATRASPFRSPSFPAGHALEADAATVQLDQTLRERQSESAALEGSWRDAADLPELIEDVRLVFRSSADAAICNAHAQLVELLCDVTQSKNSVTVP